MRRIPVGRNHEEEKSPPYAEDVLEAGPPREVESGRRCIIESTWPDYSPAGNHSKESESSSDY
jgi:hypothetical protein